MSQNWVLALDNLAAGGTIDFDAPAYILGKEPRYIGNPNREHLPLENPMYLPENIKLKNVPDIDTYGNPEDKPLQENSSWKKWLFGIVAIGGLALGGLKLTGKLSKLAISGIKNPFNGLKMPSFKKPNIKMPNFKSVGQNIIKYIKEPFTWLKSKI